jgi:hypothetical protein
VPPTWCLSPVTGTVNLSLAHAIGPGGAKRATTSWGASSCAGDIDNDGHDDLHDSLSVRATDEGGNRCGRSRLPWCWAPSREPTTLSLSDAKLVGEESRGTRSSSVSGAGDEDAERARGQYLVGANRQTTRVEDGVRGAHTFLYGVGQ